MTAQDQAGLSSPRDVSAGDQEAARIARRRELGKMTKVRLIRMCRAGVTTPGGGKRVIEGGEYRLDQWLKEDIIAAIMSAGFPHPAVSPPSPGDSAPGS